MRIHHYGEGLLREMMVGALANAGLPEDLVDAADDPAYDDAPRESHHAGMDLVGSEVGTPVIHVPGPDGDPIAFFGPVVTPTPHGEAAGTLWDGVVGGRNRRTFELKRSRDRDAIFT
jgi:hypothetical protein